MTIKTIIMWIVVVIMILLLTVGGIFIYAAIISNRKTDDIKRTIDPACLDLRVIDCQFMSSHNTYLSNIQVGYASILTAIKNTLNKGFRCIELDVTNNGSSFLVGHYYIDNGKKIPTSSTINLQACLDLIRTDAFRDSNEPLFISIEDNTDGSVNVLEYINQYLNDIVFPLDLYTPETFSFLQIRDIMGKIVPFTSAYVLNRSSSTDVSTIDYKYKAVRIYPSFNIFSLLSVNEVAMLVHLKNGANFVSINSGFEDIVYKYYTKYFKTYNIIPVSSS